MPLASSGDMEPLKQQTYGRGYDRGGGGCEEYCVARDYRCTEEMSFVVPGEQ